MRRRFLFLAMSGCLASCGGNNRSAEELANNADLLDEATVNAILGADLPPEELGTVNELDANEVSANAAEARDQQNERRGSRR